MKNLTVVVSAVVIAALSGCATPPAKRETAFFPPPPAPPRIQYLTSFSGQKDIEEQSAFQKFVFGETPTQRLDKPYGVAVFDGKIYVCDTNQTVFVFDLRARTYRPLPGAKEKGRLVQPLNISIEADGTKYVADPVRGQVVAFDRNDEYLKAYGTPGTWKPVDAAALAGWLYVADIQNGIVQVFDKKTGEVVRTIGNKGEPGQRLNLPTNIAFDSKGRLYVSDVGRFQIVRFDRNGEYDGVIGKLGNNLGHFARPRGIGIDREDRLYAVDASFNNVQIFNSQGQLLMFFGSGERGPGTLLLPAKVVVDYDNLPFFREYVAPDFEVEYLLFVTSQFGGRLVNVYGFGKEKGVAYPSDDELKQELIEKLRRQIREPAAPKEPGKPGEPVKADPGAPGPPAGPTAP
jgi:sugar lactone lactonase YvrE